MIGVLAANDPILSFSVVPRNWVLLLFGCLIFGGCSDSDSQRPDEAEKWRRAQLVFPALRIDAATNDWTGPDKLNEKFGCICWPDWWPDRVPGWLDASELAATAVIACPPLNMQATAAAIAEIGNVDEATARALLERATEAAGS